MGEILRNWIQARLGILIDLTPKVFGYYTKDGSLVAQILYSYDIISRDQLNTIIVTEDPALCRVNLKHLRFWLRFVGIDCDDESIEEISCGKGTTSLRLFYKLYLCLETKDRLHFITLQKEREKFVPTSKKFEVTRICDDPPLYQPLEHPLSKKLAKGNEVVDWHRSKYPRVVREFRRHQGKPEEDAKPYPVAEAVDRCVPEPSKTKPRSDTRKEQSNELVRFATEHRVRRKKLEGDESVPEEDESVPAIAEDPKMARAYVEWLKNRRKRTVVVSALKLKMQKALLSEVWAKMAEKQERKYDEAIAKRVLDQSRYEKQIVAKLCEVRRQKNIMIDNQKLVEDITLGAAEAEHLASYDRAEDLTGAREKDIDTECERMCELRTRLLQAKLRKVQEAHWQFCREVVNDLASIALNVADYRRVNDGRVPLALLSEWRMLFLKSLPIFDEEIPYGSTTNRRSTEEEEPEAVLKSDVWDKFDKVEMLREALFDDYVETNAPWCEGLRMPDEEAREYLELGRMVLGYVVYRLLNELYARPLDRSLLLLSKLKTVAIVLGIRNSNVCESIRSLLVHTGVQVVRIEDAINYCLEQYRKEMTDVEYIDLDIIAATEEAIKDLQGGKNRISCSKIDRFGIRRSRWYDKASNTSLETRTRKRSGGGVKEGRKSSARRTSIKAAAEEEEEPPRVLEKQTQTPRNIPYDDIDPLLSDPAYIGKWTYEFLTLGEPITNELSTKIFIEYLKSQAQAKGWVFVDYPNTYEQISQLEIALTGFAPPPEPKSADFANVTMEDIENLTPRIVFEDRIDPHALSRQSKLVPDSMTKRNDEVAGRSFATIFVRVKQQPNNFGTSEQTYEALNDDAPLIDKFYASRKIAHVFYYTSFDAATLKKLARLVIDNRLRKKPSDELFGDALNELQRDAKRGTTKTAVVRRLVTQDEWCDFDLDPDAIDQDDEDGRDLASNDFQIEFESRPARPGEPNWEWIDFPLSQALVKALAGIWKALETVYVDELKELLFMKSIQSSSIVPYADFLTRNAEQFIGRPDGKQNLLCQFHKAFNAIEAAARNDTDVKCELHRRVADFQTELWEICDRRRRDAELERKRYIGDHWTVYEAVILYNVYVGIVQVEMDRCIDTTRILQDYYTGMMKKPLQEIVAPRLVLNKIETDDADEPMTETEDRSAGSTNPVEYASDRRKRESVKATKGGSPKVTATASPPAAIDRDVLRTEIAELLTDRDRLLNVDETTLYKGILDNVRYAKNIVEALSATTKEIVRKEHLALFKSKDFPTNSTESIVPKMSSRGQDLILEWRYAFEYEIERIRLKLESIIGVARVDVAFLLETMQRTFHKIYDSIVNRYWREMKSVNEMADVFCFAIEEGIPLEKEMLLEGDTFVIRSNVYMIAEGPKKVATVREARSSVQFRVVQLARLMEIFKRVAPYQTMCERTLVYILQDLISFGQEDEETMLLPCSWYRLRPKDISILVARLFGAVDFVDWREFIVYALDLPMPSCQEMLIARDRFRIQDPELKELVSHTQYHRTALWFLECTDPCADVQRLLCDEYYREQEELYEEEFHHLDADVASSHSDQSWISYVAPCNAAPEETLRRSLAKELLGRMYMIDRCTVNYTALLLAFCKDENPREGFGKAVALAVGNRVCIDVEEGERYIEGVLRRKRVVARDAKLLREALRREALEAASKIVDHLLHRAERGIDLDANKDSEDEPVLKLFSDPMIPESVAEVESLNWEEIEYEAILTTSSLDRDAKDHEATVYWMSLDLCLTVLAAALPWHILPLHVLHDCRTLRETLTVVYQQLWDSELNEEADMALVHRVLNHEFMTRLLNSVTKFTSKNMPGIVEELLQERGGKMKYSVGHL